MRKKNKRFTALILAAAMLVSVFTSLLPETHAEAAGIATGIDVSRYQGPIDWQAVKNAGVTFAFIRVGNTTSGVDPYFAQNMAGAAAVGIKTGVYIYSNAKNAAEAQAEAGMVLQLIAPYQVSMPVVIDLENDVHKMMTPTQNAEVINNFCALIEAAGYYPMVYSNKYFFTQRIAPVVYDKWVAQYSGSCDVPGAAVWQASNTGSVAGVVGNVDIDYLFKDYSKLIVANGFAQRGNSIRFYENYMLVRNRFVSWQDAVYYIDGNGCPLTGGKTLLGDAFYFFAPDGKMYTGMFKAEEGTYYYDVDGKQKTGIVQYEGNIYYFDENTGLMITGPKEINGQVFMFDEKTGALVM